MGGVFWGAYIVAYIKYLSQALTVHFLLLLVYAISYSLTVSVSSFGWAHKISWLLLVISSIEKRYVFPNLSRHSRLWTSSEESHWMGWDECWRGSCRLTGEKSWCKWNGVMQWRHGGHITDSPLWSCDCHGGQASPSDLSVVVVMEAGEIVPLLCEGESTCLSPGCHGRAGLSRASYLFLQCLTGLTAHFTWCFTAGYKPQCRCALSI